MTTNYTEEEIKKAHEVLYNEGIKMRYVINFKAQHTRRRLSKDISLPTDDLKP